MRGSPRALPVRRRRRYERHRAVPRHTDRRPHACPLNRQPRRRNDGVHVLLRRRHRAHARARYRAPRSRAARVRRAARGDLRGHVRGHARDGPAAVRLRDRQGDVAQAERRPLRLLRASSVVPRPSPLSSSLPLARAGRRPRRPRRRRSGGRRKCYPPSRSLALTPLALRARPTGERERAGRHAVRHLRRVRRPRRLRRERVAQDEPRGHHPEGVAAGGFLPRGALSGVRESGLRARAAAPGHHGRVRRERRRRLEVRLHRGRRDALPGGRLHEAVHGERRRRAASSS